MLTLLKAFFERLDFLSIAETIRKSKNRRLSARLFVILSQSYEITEIYHILLRELRAGLESHQTTNQSHRFFLNPARVSSFLARQASNLQVMETLVSDLLNEIRLIEPKFADAYRSAFPGKFGILFEAQHFLNNARLPLSEGDPQHFPCNDRGEYRALWFTWELPTDKDRDQTYDFLYGNVSDKRLVVDVNIHDGDAFFRELELYFQRDDPVGKLRQLEELTESYRKALLENFDVSDLLTDIAKVRRHYCWVD
jgi:hypothetical protein